jgi:hypothetical protein
MVLLVVDGRDPAIAVAKRVEHAPGILLVAAEAERIPGPDAGKRLQVTDVAPRQPRQLVTPGGPPDEVLAEDPPQISIGLHGTSPGLPGRGGWPPTAPGD